MFTHTDIHKQIRNSPYRKTHKQIDHMRRLHSNIHDVQSFREADCDTDHCLVFHQVRERLAISKQATQMFVVERFNVR